MKYCNQCGNALKEEQKFCGKCGNDITSAANSEVSKPETNKDIDNTVVQNSEVKESQPRKPLKLPKFKKIHIIIGSILLGIIILATGSIFALKSFNSPERTINNFQEAIISKDKDKLAKILTTTDTRLTIDDKNLDGFLELFNANPALINDLTTMLTSQIYEVEAIGMAKNAPNDFLKLAVKSDNFLFTTYGIEILPVYLTVTGPAKNIAITLNDVEVHKSTSDEFSDKIGPFIPGKYVLKSNFKSGNNIANYAEDLLLNNPSSDYTVDTLPGYTLITVESNYSDANIFVNGTDTGIKVKDYATLGPVKEYSEIYASFTNDKGTYKSKTYTINSYYKTAKVDFDTKTFTASGVASTEKVDTSEAESLVKSLLDSYLNKFASAVNSGNFNLLVDYLYPNSTLYTSQKTLVDKLYKENVKEEFVSSSYKDFKLDASTTTGTIVSTEVYKIKSGTGDYKTETFTWTYGFKYNTDTKTYQLTDLK